MQADGTDLLRSPGPSERWVVLHARPRCEKKLAAFCEEHHAVPYLPLLEKEHRYGGRIRRFTSPLFPGYVFCLTSADFAVTLKQNGNVANLLEVLDQEVLVNQLRQVDKALGVGRAVEVMPYLEEGKPVRVTHGPLKGVEGVVLRLKGETKVVLNVEMIQQAVAMEVDFTLLEPI